MNAFAVVRFLNAFLNVNITNLLKVATYFHRLHRTASSRRVPSLVEHIKFTSLSKRSFLAWLLEGRRVNPSAAPRCVR